jgi:hypothetical protein
VCVSRAGVVQVRIPGRGWSSRQLGRGGRLSGRQESPRQRSRAIVVPEQRDPGPLLGLLAAPFRGRWVGGEDGPPERRAQLPAGLVLRPDQNPALDRPGEIGVKRQPGMDPGTGSPEPAQR